MVENETFLNVYRARKIELFVDGGGGNRSSSVPESVFAFLPSGKL